jgi:homoaconitase/3-isopropylmalate dehydratase large subunit
VNAELPIIMAPGRIWLKVPTTLRIELSGNLAEGVMSRDVIQYVLRDVGPDKGDYRAFEFTGPAIGKMDMDARLTICNPVIEIGGKVGIVPPDEITIAYLKSRVKEFTPVWGGSGCGV